MASELACNWERTEVYAIYDNDFKEISHILYFSSKVIGYTLSCIPSTYSVYHPVIFKSTAMYVGQFMELADGIRSNFV